MEGSGKKVMAGQEPAPPLDPVSLPLILFRSQEQIYGTNNFLSFQIRDWKDTLWSNGCIPLNPLLKKVILDIAHIFSTAFITLLLHAFSINPAL